MKKLIKNYTTDIPVERTTAEIQKILAQNGARGIALEYDEMGAIKDIFFKTIVRTVFENCGRIHLCNPCNALKNNDLIF
jgi:tRNA nucleotidyltransferase/poly(A) polymerase